MKTASRNNCRIRQLTTASGLSMAIGLSAWAQPQVMQPNSAVPPIAPASTATLAHDRHVQPVACQDVCCCGSGRSRAACCPKRVTEEVKKKCWKVSSEMVCIPGFRFVCNWKKGSNNSDGCDCGDACCTSGSCCDGAPPTCGRVRCVKVLEKHETTCEKCGYEWEVKCVRSRSGGCCKNCDCDRCPSCGGRSCCASTDPTEADPQPTAAARTSTQGTATDIGKPLPIVARRLLPWLK